MNVLTTLYFKLIFWKTKTFFKKTRVPFFCSKTKIESAIFPYKTALPEKPMLRQIEWKVQHGPITKDGILPLTTLFFWKFCFRVRTSSKELIRYTSYPNAHIHTFCKRWSFICFFPVSIFKQTCIFQLQIFLSMYDLLVDTKR